MGRKSLIAPIFGAVLFAGCTADASGNSSHVDLGDEVPSTSRNYSAPVKLGNGTVRTYVVLGGEGEQTPLEVGVAVDANGLEGLPTEMQMMHLPLPTNAPQPYQFVMFGWNPEGHEPDGIYDRPHFDFHFYFTSHAAVDAIVPADPKFAEKANNLPADEVLPPFFVVPAPPGADAASTAVPQMGVHWIDVRSPELQGMLGKPEAFQPFTKTFIYGSWDGQFTFLEPMITRAHLLSQPDEIIPIPQPARYDVPGWYPDSYRITYDPLVSEYRIALTGLAWHE